MTTDDGGEVARLRAEVASLRAQLSAALDARPPTAQRERACPAPDRDGSACPEPGEARWRGEPHGLTKDLVERYSRQLVLPEFGVAGMHSPGAPDALGPTALAA
jgi:hypothetical protein